MKRQKLKQLKQIEKMIKKLETYQITQSKLATVFICGDLRRLANVIKKQLDNEK